MRPHILRLLAAPALGAVTLSSHAVKVNDQLYADGFLSGAGQCQRVSALFPAEPFG